MRSFLLGAFALRLLAQSNAPSNYVGVGAGYNGGTIPNLNVTFSYATLIAKSSPALYSFTSGDYVSARTKPFSVKSSLRTGLMLVVRDWPCCTIGEIFNAGVSGGNSGGILPSLGVGGIVLFKIAQGFTLGIDVHESTAVGQGWAVQSVFEVGHSW